MSTKCVLCEKCKCCVCWGQFGSNSWDCPCKFDEKCNECSIKKGITICDNCSVCEHKCKCDIVVNCKCNCHDKDYDFDLDDI